MRLHRHRRLVPPQQAHDHGLHLRARQEHCRRHPTDQRRRWAWNSRRLCASSPKASSSAFHHALSGTQIAPAAAHAQNVYTHSGLLAESTATRSPRPIPRRSPVP